MMIPSSEPAVSNVDGNTAQATWGVKPPGCESAAKAAEQFESRQQTITKLNEALTRQLVKQLTAIASTTGLCREIITNESDQVTTSRTTLSRLLESLESLSGAMIDTTRRVRDLAADHQPGRRVVCLTTIWAEIILVASARLKSAGKQYQAQLSDSAGEARVDVVELTQVFLRGTTAALAALPAQAAIHFIGHRFPDRYAMLISDASGLQFQASEVRAWLDDSYAETPAVASDLARQGFVTPRPPVRSREFPCFVIWVPLV